jgi:hypothetical protein
MKILPILCHEANTSHDCSCQAPAQYGSTSYICPFRHYSTSSDVTSVQDYVIVGAGSAGCVLANRLSAKDDNKVLVLEAGPKDYSWSIRYVLINHLHYRL